MKPDIQHWLAETLGHERFHARYPGYVHVLAALESLDDPAVAVMAVSRGGRRLRLHINRAFFEAKPRFLAGVLLHEIHHVVLGHLTRPDLREVAFPDLMELAMETSANEYIDEPLPGHPCRWQDYQALGLRAHQSTRERYERLAQARGDGRIPSPRWEAIDGHGFLADAADGDDADAGLRRVLATLAVNATQGPEGSALRIAGRTPGELLEALDADPSSPPASLDWRQELAAFPMRLRGRRCNYSYSRPNRRFPQRLGEVPGRLRRPGDRPALLAVVDTSGSMAQETLAQVAREIGRLAAKADVTVVECDAAIQRVYLFAGDIREVRGRGGTDLRPAFAPTFLALHRTDGVVYFTDGQGPWPPDDPAIPILWVLADASPFACPWGRRVQMAPGD